MVNRKELISRIFRKETVVDTIKAIRPVYASVVSQNEVCAESGNIHIPELTDDMIYFEAMRLGIDPSNFTVEELKQRIVDELSAITD